MTERELLLGLVNEYKAGTQKLAGMLKEAQAGVMSKDDKASLNSQIEELVTKLASAEMISKSDMARTREMLRDPVMLANVSLQLADLSIGRKEASAPMAKKSEFGMGQAVSRGTAPAPAAPVETRYRTTIRH